jgi:hypothetical protein
MSIFKEEAIRLVISVILIPGSVFNAKSLMAVLKLTISLYKGLIASRRTSP